MIYNVKILDNAGNAVYIKEVYGNGYFAATSVPNEDISLEYEYSVEM